MTTIARVRKDTFYSTARPWCADLVHDGVQITSYAYGFDTKTKLVQHLQDIFEMTNIKDYKILRAVGKDK